MPVATRASLRSGFLVRGDRVAPCDRVPRQPSVPGDARETAVAVAGTAAPRPPPACCGLTQRQPPDTGGDRPPAAHSHESFSHDDRTDHSRSAVELPGPRTREKAEGGCTGPGASDPAPLGVRPPSDSHGPHAGAATTGPQRPTDPTAPSPGASPPSGPRPGAQAAASTAARAPEG